MLNQKQKILFCFVFALVVFLIVFRFTETPRVWIDEGIFTETAKNLVWHAEQGIQVAPGKIVSSAIVSTSGYPLIFPVSVSFWLFGVGLWQARLPMLVYMFILALLFYLFAKKRYGFYSAIAAVLLLLSFSPFYGNGRPVQGEVVGVVFLLLGALLFLYWESKNFSANFLPLLSGASFGLAASSKPLYLILLLPALIFSFGIFFRRISNKKGIIIFFSTLLLFVALWLFIQFPTKELFLKAIPIYLSGNPNVSANAWDSIRTNFLRFFTESTPILFLLLLIAVSTSVFIKIFGRKREHLCIAEFIILAFAVLNWLAYLKGPGWYRHFFPAHILLYLLLPGAILFFKNYFSRDFIGKILLLLIFSLISMQFYHLIFLSQTSFTIRRDRNAELTSLLAEIGPFKKIFFLNTIEAAVFLKSDNYFQYLDPSDFLIFGKEELDNLRHLCNADYVLLSRKETRYGDLFSCYVESSRSGSRSGYVLLVKK